MQVDEFSLRRSQGISDQDVFYFYGRITKYDPKNPIIHFYSHPLQGLSKGNGLLKVYFADYDELAVEIASKCEDYARTKPDHDSIKYFVEVNYL